MSFKIQIYAQLGMENEVSIPTVPKVHIGTLMSHVARLSSVSVFVNNENYGISMLTLHFLADRGSFTRWLIIVFRTGIARLPFLIYSYPYYLFYYFIIYLFFWRFYHIIQLIRQLNLCIFLHFICSFVYGVFYVIPTA